MNEFDARVFDLLEAFTPEVRHWPDWPDVVHRTRTRHTRRLVVVLAAAVAVLGFAAGVTAALGGFHAWLSGAPGKPALQAESTARCMSCSASAVATRCACGSGLCRSGTAWAQRAHRRHDDAHG